MLENKKKLTRRELLKISGTVAAGAVQVSCSSPNPERTEEAMPEEDIEKEVVSEEPETLPVSGHVVCMHILAEFNQDHVNEFMEQNPGITLEIVDGEDPTRFFAMYAAGTPPDIYRVQAPSVPQFLARGLLLDLTPYFNASDMIDVDDLMPASNYYKANSPLDVGSGKIYGMVKDFSPDLSIFLNTALFEAAGFDSPDNKTPMTYDEVMQFSKDLIVFNGDRLMQYGFAWETSWIDRYWQNGLDETGQSLYSDGFDKIIISDNEDAKAMVKWYYDMCKQQLTVSPQLPSPGGWSGYDFLTNMLAMEQYGYWFNVLAESDDNRGNVVMLLAPTWTGVRNNRTITATGAIMTADSQNPDAAFKVFEFYHAGAPAEERAVYGWGVPAFKSWLDKIPQESDFQNQVYAVLQDELSLEPDPIQFNPFLGENVVPNSWSKFLDQALVGDINFAELITCIEDEVNLVISESIDRIMD